MAKAYKNILFFMFTAFFVFSQTGQAAASEPIEEIRGLIQQYYVEDVPASTLSKPTIKEITDQLDPYSVYMSKKEYERFSNTINQQLVGIGVVLEEHEQGVMVIKTIPNGPAELSGLVAGDIITKANGKSLQGESIQTAVTYISGEENTSVTITFLQKSTGLSITKTIERKKIFLPNVETAWLGGNIGYIRLHSFSMDSAEKIQQAIKTLKGAKSYIFDLRDNGGGYVSAAQEVAGLFPDVEQAFQLRERSQAPQVYKALKQATQFTAPVHLLINENSASASEMVSATVKEQNGATLYGQTSYGKGSMQSLFVLSDQSVLKLTTAKFYSPNGTAINGVGVVPNIETAAGEELARSHQDLLEKMFSSYKKLPSLKGVPVTKTFTITMNKQMNWDAISPNNIQLIHLGGQEAETKFEIMNEKSIKVIPKQPLLSQENYILVIHPQWKGKDNTAMKQGTYLEITVK